MFDPMNLLNSRLSWLRNEMDQLLGRYWGEAESREFPALNVWEDPDAFYVEAELPGFKIEDVELTVVGSTLTMKGERKLDAPEAGVWHRRERASGPFTRVLELDAEIDSEKLDAAFKNGVLTVKLPKAAAAKPRKIEIKRLEERRGS